MPSLRDVTQITRNDDHFQAEVPDGWQQGRGAYGGLVVALLARAMRATVEDPARRLRALSAELPGALMTGPARLDVETLREGRTLSNLEVRLRQGEKFRARASGIYATEREDLVLKHPRGFGTPLTVAKAFDDAQDWAPPQAPRFVSHFEMRATCPGPTQGDRAEVHGWVWGRERPATYDASDLLALVDVYWPTSFQVMEQFRPLVTVSFHALLLVDPATVRTDAPLYYRARGDGHHDGFYAELRELWQDDRLLVSNHQSFAVL